MAADATPSPGASPQRRTLEYWLTRATDPYVSEASRLEHVGGFCEQVNEELEGPQIATRLLAHKIQSPFEVEAMHALEVLDSCVRNCGLRFHNEVGKFRFLNELIRILSPKYLGAQTNDRVKQRAIELMYGWKRGMPHMGKISQAYDMLKTQGIIAGDPVYMDAVLESAPAAPVPEQRTASFEDQEKSRLLSELLRSPRPEDLMAANRLIKSMVKAEDVKMEKMAKRGTDLESAAANARLLSDMVAQFSPSQPSAGDGEVMKDLVSSLVAARPALFRYAGEAAEGDEATLARVLTVNDDVSKAIDEFKAQVEPHVPAPNTAPPPPTQIRQPQTVQSLLEGLDMCSAEGNLLGSHVPSSSSNLSVAASDDVGIIGNTTPMVTRKAPPGIPTDDLLSGVHTNSAMPQDIEALIQQLKTSQSEKPPEPPRRVDLLSGRDETSSLDLLSDSLILQNLPSGTKQSTFHSLRTIEEQRQKIPLRDLPKQPSTGLATPISPSAIKKVSVASSNGSDGEMIQLNNSPSAPEVAKLPPNLDAICIQLQDILPGKGSPLILIDESGLKVVLHPAGNVPAPGVGVCLAHVSSSLGAPVEGLRLALSSSLAIRSEAASGSALAAFNPILPPATLLQVFYVEVPSDGPTALRSTLQYTLDGAEKRLVSTLQLRPNFFQSAA